MYPKILSDSTVVITNIQLKTANKLITEGKKYKELYNESNNQINNYQKLINNYELQDSLRIIDITNTQMLLNKEIKTSNKLKKLNKGLSISTIGLAITTLIFIIL